MGLAALIVSVIGSLRYDTPEWSWKNKPNPHPSLTVVTFHHSSAEFTLLRLKSKQKLIHSLSRDWIQIYLKLSYNPTHTNYYPVNSLHISRYIIYVLSLFSDSASEFFKRWTNLWKRSNCPSVMRWICPELFFWKPEMKTNFFLYFLYCPNVGCRYIWPNNLFVEI